MKNFKAFLTHYKHVVLIWALYWFFAYQLAWPSNFHEVAAYNDSEGLGYVWAFIAAFFWIVCIGLFFSTYTFNQWTRFKKSEWYRK
jgi:hypothetical protein